MRQRPAEGAREVVRECRRTDAQEGVHRAHDRCGDTGEDERGDKDRHLLEQEQGRGVVGPCERRDLPTQDQGLHRDADADEEQLREEHAHRHEERVPAEAAHVLQHVVLVRDVRLAERTDGEDEEEGECHHRPTRPPGAEQGRVGRLDRARDGRESAPGVEGEDEDDRRRDRHQHSLEDVGVDAGEDPAAGGVGEGDGGADPDPRREADAEDRVDDDAECEHVRGDVADDADEDRDRTESLCRRGPVPRADGVGHGDELPHLTEQAHPLAEDEGAHRVRDGRREDDEDGRHPDRVDESGTADEGEATECGGHGGEREGDESDPPARDEEVVGRPGAARGPESDRGHHDEVHDADADDHGLANGRDRDRLQVDREIRHRGTPPSGCARGPAP